MALNTKTSIVDALKSKGLPSSFDSRAKLAARKGIEDYTGSAAQNVKLLGLVNKGAGTSPKASSPAAAAKPAASVSKPAAPSAPKVAAPAKTVSARPASAPVKAVISSGARPAGGATGKPSPSASSSKVGTGAGDKTTFYREPVSSSDGLLYKSGALKKPLKETDAARANSKKNGTGLDSPVTQSIVGAMSGAGAFSLAGAALKGIGGAVSKKIGSAVAKGLSGSEKSVATKAASLVKPNLSRVNSVATTKGTSPASYTASSKPGPALATKLDALPAAGRRGGAARTTQRNAINRAASNRISAGNVSQPVRTISQQSSAPKPAPPVVKAAVKAVAPKPAPVKPTGTPKAAPAAKVAATKPPSPPPVPKGSVPAKTPIKAAPGKTTVSTPKASNNAAPAAKPTPKRKP